jgi:hypothetical protein
MDLTIPICYSYAEVILMAEILSAPCTDAELSAAAALFYKKFAEDPVFRAVFPDPAAGRAHCREFVAAYAHEGEIQRITEDGMLLAAALWSLPGQTVPSPTWDFLPEEPCCKLYLIASRRPGAGAALLDYARLRFAGKRLVTLCGAARQAAYFRRRGYQETGRTGFGTILTWEGCALEQPKAGDPPR